MTGYIIKTRQQEQKETGHIYEIKSYECRECRTILEYTGSRQNENSVWREYKCSNCKKEFIIPAE